MNNCFHICMRQALFSIINKPNYTRLSMLSLLLVYRLHARLRLSSPRTSRGASYFRSPSLVEGQVSGVKWHNAASYIPIVHDPLHVLPTCVPPKADSISRAEVGKSLPGKKASRLKTYGRIYDCVYETVSTVVFTGGLEYEYIYIHIVIRKNGRTYGFIYTAINTAVYF